MNRLFVILAALCACTGLLHAQEGARQIAITPFAEALIVNPQSDSSEGTVVIKKIGYFFKPNYQLFLNGGPALRVSLQYLGSHLDVYYQGEKEVKIVETNWNGTQYVGTITTPESLANAGINEADLLKALSFVPAMHFPNSNTWSKAPKDVVIKGEVALLIHGEQLAQEPTATEEVEEEQPASEEAFTTTEEAKEEPIEEPVVEPVTEEPVIEVVVEEPAIEVVVEEPESEETQVAAQEEPTPVEQVLALADQFEEAHADLVVDAPTPEQEAEAIAIFQESLPEELKEVVIESPGDIQLDLEQKDED